MADASKVFGITINPNNPNLIPLKHELGLCTVEEIIISWPAGCAGLVQCVVTFASSPVYPDQTGMAYEFDDYVLVIPVSNQGTSGDWGVLVNNSDVIPHQLHVAYHYNYWQGNSSGVASAAISL